MPKYIFLQPGTEIFTHVQGQDDHAVITHVQPQAVEIVFNSGQAVHTTPHELMEHLGSLDECPICQWQDFNSF